MHCPSEISKTRIRDICWFIVTALTFTGGRYIFKKIPDFHWKAGDEVERIGIIQQEVVDLLGAVISKVSK